MLGNFKVFKYNPRTNVKYFNNVFIKTCYHKCVQDKTILHFCIKTTSFKRIQYESNTIFGIISSPKNSFNI